MSHDTLVNESCHTYEWVISHIWTIHVTHMNESYHTHKLVMSHLWTSHVTHTNESCHTYEWVSSSFLALSLSLTLCVHVCLFFPPHASFHTSPLPASFSCSRQVLCPWSKSHVTHKNESCHTYDWVVSHIWMSHSTHMNESCHTYEWVMSHIWMSHVTHMNESCHTYEWVMSYIW